MMMKREIKFRAWDGDKMHYGAECGVDTGVQRHFGDILITKGWEVMQFTGLLDRNGREIYEGDVVEAKSWHPMRYAVEFIEGGFCFTNPKLSSPIDINLMYSSVGCVCEVIGNIHENPKLLKP